MVRDEDGTVAWYEGFVEDITEEKLRSARLGFWERAGVSSPHAIALVSHQGQVMHANPSFHALFTPTEVVHFQQILDLLDPPQGSESWRTTRLHWLSHGIGFQEQVSLLRPGVAPRAVSISVQPVEKSFAADAEAVVTVICP